MTRTLRRLALASTAALALAAGRANACDARAEARFDSPPPQWEPVAPVVAYAPPVYAPAAPVYAPAPPVWDTPATIRVEWRGRGQGHGELRHEYRRLDLARERFYASWDHRPWSQHRFESWYGARRAELDRGYSFRRHDRDDD